MFSNAFRPLLIFGVLTVLTSSSARAVSIMGRTIIRRNNVEHLRNTEEYARKLKEIVEERSKSAPNKIRSLDHGEFVEQVKQLIHALSEDVYRSDLTNSLGKGYDRSLQMDPFSYTEQLFEIRDKIQAMGLKAAILDISRQVPFILTKNTIIGDVLKVPAIPIAMALMQHPILGGFTGDLTGRVFGWALTVYEISRYKGKNALYLVPALVSRYEKLDELTTFNTEDQKAIKAVLDGLKAVSVHLEIPMIESLTRRHRLDGSQIDLVGVFAIQALKEIERRKAQYWPKSTDIARDQSQDKEAVELQDLSDQIQEWVAKSLGTKVDAKKFQNFIRDFLYPI